MELFLVILGGLSCFLSGLLYAFLRKGTRSVLISAAASLPLFFGYIFLIRDEFGFWVLYLSFGMICCLMGSAMGIVAVAQLKNRKQ